MESLSYRTVRGLLELGGPLSEASGPARSAGSGKATGGKGQTHRFVRPLSVYEDQLLLFTQKEGNA